LRGSPDPRTIWACPHNVDRISCTLSASEAEALRGADVAFARAVRAGAPPGAESMPQQSSAGAGAGLPPSGGCGQCLQTPCPERQLTCSHPNPLLPGRTNPIRVLAEQTQFRVLAEQTQFRVLAEQTQFRVLAEQTQSGFGRTNPISGFGRTNPIRFWQNEPNPVWQNEASRVLAERSRCCVAGGTRHNTLELDAFRDRRAVRRSDLRKSLLFSLRAGNAPRRP
jgi:hypothetical protein